MLEIFGIRLALTFGRIGELIATSATQMQQNPHWAGFDGVSFGGPG
jgi:hypothetical protein